MLAYMKRMTVKPADDLDREMRDEAVRRLLAAGAAGSGRSDVSVRIGAVRPQHLAAFRLLARAAQTRAAASALVRAGR